MIEFLLLKVYSNYSYRLGRFANLGLLGRHRPLKFLPRFGSAVGQVIGVTDLRHGEGPFIANDLIGNGGDCCFFK